MTATPERSPLREDLPRPEVTRLTALEREVERLRLELEESESARSRLLATVSHELRTPLQVISGYADLFIAGIPVPLPQVARDQAEHIARAAQHLAGLVDQLLTFTRIESGREGLRLEPVDLVSLARQAAALVEPLVRRKALRLALNLPDQPTLVVETDGVKVRQVIYNLLSNAVKFTDQGEVVLSLCVRGQGREVRFEVHDTGCGMTAEHLERAFEAFWQADRLTGTGVAPRGGTGLGLSISRELARMLGGDLTARSEKGRGSTFTLTLPVDPPPAAAADGEAAAR